MKKSNMGEIRAVGGWPKRRSEKLKALQTGLERLSGLGELRLVGEADRRKLHSADDTRDAIIHDVTLTLARIRARREAAS